METPILKNGWNLTVPGSFCWKHPTHPSQSTPTLVKPGTFAARPIVMEVASPWTSWTRKKQHHPSLPAPRWNHRWSVGSLKMMKRSRDARKQRWQDPWDIWCLMWPEWQPSALQVGNKLSTNLGELGNVKTIKHKAKVAKTKQRADDKMLQNATRCHKVWPTTFFFCPWFFHESVFFFKNSGGMWVTSNFHYPQAMCSVVLLEPLWPSPWPVPSHYALPERSLSDE